MFWLFVDASEASLEDLLDCNFSSGDGAAGEEADAAGGELDDTIVGSVDGVVAAELGAFAGALGGTDLADDNLASFDGLATK
jgi:hypothetical protein